jgi:NTP pyrophosphatase (non-canonical NTP hydrolase)
VDESLSLDDLYHMTAHIYGDRNSSRSKENTFAHFVEVCGMLTVEARQKRRGSFVFTDGLCKTLAWYFPLLAKLKIRSVEELIFRKFPNLCPYCRKSPHEEGICKNVRGTDETVDKALVMDAYQQRRALRPGGLDEWQEMFARIYPRSLSDGPRSILGLFEELGELAEAVRVYDVHPQYFFGEAADTFSYIMGLANEHTLREHQEGREFSFEQEYLRRYPGLCAQCGQRVCVCPAIPQGTIGRMAKELELNSDENPYITDLAAFRERGEAAAFRALEAIGGYEGLAAHIPSDRNRGEQALIQLCLAIADAVEESSTSLAASLRSETIKLGRDIPNSASSSLNLEKVIGVLRDQGVDSYGEI